MRGLSLAALLALLAGPALAQTVYAAATPKGQYASLNALPDWGGVWVIEPVPGAPRPSAPEAKGAYRDRYLAAKAQADANHGEFANQRSSFCQAPGVPYHLGLAQYPIEFLFTPGRVTVLMEAWTQVRRIFTDGRPHPDADPTYYGHSTGHWEGQTLVVDTVHLKPEALITAGLGHSDKETLSERLHLSPTDPDVLLDEATVSDPEALEKPWTVTYRYRRHRDWDILEYICENDRNPVGADGKAAFKE